MSPKLPQWGAVGEKQQLCFVVRCCAGVRVGSAFKAGCKSHVAECRPTVYVSYDSAYFTTVSECVKRLPSPGWMAPMELSVFVQRLAGRKPSVIGLSTVFRWCAFAHLYVVHTTCVVHMQFPMSSVLFVTNTSARMQCLLVA